MGKTYFLVGVDDRVTDEFLALFHTRVVDVRLSEGGDPDGFIVEVGTEMCAVCGGEDRVAVCLECDVEYPDKEDRS